MNWLKRTKLLLCSLILLHFSSHVVAIEDTDYLPKDVTYNPQITLPNDVIGAPVGEWHVRHDQLVQYMRHVAEQSPRMQLKEIGRTHENRPLLQIFVSDPANLAKLESIRVRHMKNWHEPSDKVNESDPVVVNMGFSVHGNEPSGANSSLLLAYYLAAAEGEKIDQLLKNTVIILDPVLNPDGLARFAQWVNSHRGKNISSDPQHREHVEGWPNGRTNHYWFDLNRDWLLLTHPESQARIEQYHRWRPHVLTDFHEMGSHSTYFFQPGVPSRTNPWTPVDNVRLTGEFAKFFAHDFDKVNRSYFSEEAFDDFYYGKGSSYPDAHGSIGILFEQASSRGHQQETINGLLTFPRTIENQFLMSLSTLRGAVALREQLLEMQRVFKKETESLAKADDVAGYLISEKHDKARLFNLLAKLDAHQITYYRINKAVEIDNINFSAEDAYFVPLDQIQYRLIKSLFSNRKRFNDNTFYDVSNWNIALAYNIEYRPVERSRWRKKVSYAKTAPIQSSRVKNKLDAGAVAYAFSWQDSNAPTLLQALLDKKLKARISGSSFNATTSIGEATFLPGAVVISKSDKQPEAHVQMLQALADQHNIRIWSISSGLTTQGPDLGSRRVWPVTPPKVMIIGGKGISQYEVGEVWHFLDQQIGLAPSIVEWDNLGSINLDDYTHIIAVSGNYAKVDAKAVKKLGSWLKEGGVLIGQGSGNKWLAKNDWLSTGFMDGDDIDKAFDTSTLKYEDREALSAKKRIAGAAYLAEVDLTHPLMFGFTQDKIAMFKTSNLVMRKPSEPFITVGSYSNSPLLAGYSADEMQNQVANSAAIIAHRQGSGRVIAVLDRTNFRGYWQGTNRILSNALYLSEFVNGRAK